MPTDSFHGGIDGPTSDESSFTDGAFGFPRLDAGAYTIDVDSTDGTAKVTVHVASATGDENARDSRPRASGQRGLSIAADTTIDHVTDLVDQLAK